MDIVQTFVDGFTTFTSGMGAGVVNLFNTVFLNTEGKLSNIAIWGITFGAIGLGTFLLRKFTSKAG